MKADKKPLIHFENGGQSFAIQNNLPQSASFFGRSYIDLGFGDRAREYFKAECYQVSRHETIDRLQKRVSPSVISSLLEKSRRPEMRISTTKISRKSQSVLPSITDETTEIDTSPNIGKTDWWTIGVHNLSKRLQNIDLMQLESEAGKMGYRTMWYRNHFGALDFYLINTENQEITPRLFLIESYRISSSPIGYGAGKTLKTLSLAPGEKTHISVHTFKHRKSEENYGSCILDSNSPESAHEFQNCMDSENYCKDSHFSAMEFHSATEIDPLLFACNPPYDSVVHINIARSEFVKNVWKAIAKHTSRASSKRDVMINTEVVTNFSDEHFISREISNPNPGCTVNYIFRQLNQEYLTALHLTDVRVGYSNGLETREYPLQLMDNLLSEFIFPEMQEEVKENILNAVMDIHDCDNETIRNKDVIRTISVPDSPAGKKIYAFNSGYTTAFSDKSGAKFELEGIVMATRKFIIPTDSVMVDSLLGEGDIQDLHMQNMQEQELRERTLNNDMKEREVEKLNLAESIVRETTPEKAKLFEEVFNRFDNDKWS